MSCGNDQDQTVIATAIPSITDQFGSVDDIGWYASAYLLTSCLFQLLWGRIYTHFPLQHCLLVAMVIFLAGSALCGAAPNPSSLVAGRAVAGIGAAGLLGGSGLYVFHSVASAGFHPRALNPRSMLINDPPTIHQGCNAFGSDEIPWIT